ncbi:hypothetical protein ONQ62_28050, partial [Salmonella enterica subsp. enterica serovar Virginia]|nr:hypothetical protein [Salmonella enterica subsp. enterica serovar Virginia]
MTLRSRLSAAYKALSVLILRILLLNISAFGLPKAAYLNPAWYGAIVPEDAWSWAILDIVAQA